MVVLTDLRARRAAKQVLGSAGRVVWHRSDGSPVVEVDGRQYVYRDRDGERYFRMRVPCSQCGAQFTWRGPRITTATDFAALTPGPVACRECDPEQQSNSDAEPIRARVPPPRRRRVPRWVLAVALVIVLWSGFCFLRAASSAQRAKAALVAAETSLKDRDIPAARVHLAEAAAALDGVDDNLGRLGPVRTVMRWTPVVRVQLHGVEAYVGAGRELTTAAERLTDALDGLLNPQDPNASLETTLEPLRNFDAALREGIASLDKAAEKINTLNGYRLFGPLDGARRDLGRRLPEAHQKAIDAEEGVSALLAFVGGDGPRRYLVMAQNPDEVRPTGGFLGSYGVLDADGAKVHLERFDAIEDWTRAHPDVVVPPDEQATPFYLAEDGGQQRLSNVNATVFWPGGAQLAQRLWAQAGEVPVDGVLLITPDMLVRVLHVLGPVAVPEYGETITESNLLERLDFYTHELPTIEQLPGGRKEFLSALAGPVMKAVLHAPSDKWVDLGEQLAAAGDQREMMAWSADTKIEDVLVTRGWDGQLPDVAGDFFFNGDFEYVAKNGRGLQRTFNHVVRIEPDGSGTVETTMTLANTLPEDLSGKLNIGATIYSVLYGPAGATLDPSSDEPDVPDEIPYSGHPAQGYALSAPPLGSDAVKIVWRVPELVEPMGNGTWRYSLLWRHVATNAADTLHLEVHLPDGWNWVGDAPRADMRLDADIDGEWLIHDR